MIGMDSALRASPAGGNRVEIRVQALYIALQGVIELLAHKTESA
jgi:hypothetical protein